MSTRALARLVGARSFGRAQPRVPQLRRNSTTVAAPLPVAPTVPPDDRPFVLRHKWVILISTAFGSWVRSPAPKRRPHHPLHGPVE